MSDERPRVLFAHERPAIAGAVVRVLDAFGFAVETASAGDAARDVLQSGRRFAALVVDVALPVVPGYELVEDARAAGVEAVVLVASVYSRTSYKRRPSKLYGADDYVEIHHLGDHLPAKLRRLLGLAEASAGAEKARISDEAYTVFKAEGDTRLAISSIRDPARLASLIVSDMVLYNGDAVANAGSLAEVVSALDGDLGGARAMFAELRGEAEPSVGAADGHDHLAEALREVVGHLVTYTTQPSLATQEVDA